MADVDYDAFDAFEGGSPEAEEASSISVALNWIGAAISLALVVGLLAWGYHLGVRDVSDVPVVRAMTGPMRVQPADPGGAQAAHQGLAVNRVQGLGGVSEPAREVLLAPPPLDLFEPVRNDPGDAAGRSGEVPTGVSDGKKIPVAAEGAGGESAEADAQAEAAILAVAGRVAGGGGSVFGVFDDVPGVRWSARPMPRPRAATSAGGDELDVANLAPGTRLVQVGDYQSPETARSEWERLWGSFENYMVGKSPVVMKAESAGRTFYRLRVAGFESLDEARGFCSELLARDTACVPVVHRR